MGLARRAALAPRSLFLRELTAADPAGTLRVSYIGEGASEAYIRRLYFPAGPPPAPRRAPLWRLHSAVDRLTGPASLLFIEVNRLLEPLLPRGGWRTCPWIRERVLLDDPRRLSRRRNIEATFGRKVRQFAYRADCTRDRAAVAAFHREFYAPYVTARFEAEVRLRTVGELQTIVDHGFLLRVFHDARWVSGAVCRVREGRLSVFAFGHLPREQWDLRHGGMSAVYYFLFEWAEKSAVREVDLLRSRPNGADGVFEHKRRWGARPGVDDWPHTSIQVFPPAAPLIPPPLDRQLVLVAGELIEVKDALGLAPAGRPRSGGGIQARP